MFVARLLGRVCAGVVVGRCRWKSVCRDVSQDVMFGGLCVCVLKTFHDEAFDDGCGFGLEVGQGVGAGVHRHGDGGMSEPFPDDLGMDAAEEAECGAGMAEGVEGDGGEGGVCDN